MLAVCWLKFAFCFFGWWDVGRETTGNERLVFHWSRGAGRSLMLLSSPREKTC